MPDTVYTLELTSDEAELIFSRIQADLNPNTNAYASINSTQKQTTKKIVRKLLRVRKGFTF